MFTKIRNTTLALAAVATLGAASLVTSTTSADAMRGGGFHGGGGFRGGGHVGMRHVGGGRQMGGMRHVGIRHVNIRHGNFRRHVGHRHPHWCRLHGRCGIHVRWHRPIYTAPVAAVATYTSTTPVAAVAGRCTCLTKEYTQDNLVVFQDVCTKEFASAPVGTTQNTQMQQDQTQPQAR
jgi:hypothetical protein